MATFASLIHSKEVVKNMMDNVLEQTPLYKDVLEKGMEKTIIAALAARFGSVSDRLSERVHNIRERNSSLMDELIKLAVTAKDLGEFERKLDRMM